MTVHTDNFNRASGALGANWTDNVRPNGEFYLDTNNVTFVSGPCGVVYTGGTALGNDQRASIKIDWLPDATGICGPVVRMATSAMTGYALIIDNSNDNCAIVSYSAGTPTSLVSDTLGSLTDGDVFALQVVGTTLTAYQNDVQILTTTSSAHSSGYAGFYANGDAYSSFVDDFSATDELSTVAPSVTTTSLPGAVVGVAYSQTLTATGDAPITWSVQSGSLPNGLSLNASTGAITGTPTTGGSSTFTVRATNSAGYDDQSLTIVVSPAPSITVTPDPTTATVGGTRTETITRSVAAGAGGVTYNLTSSNASVATVPANTTMAEAATTKTFDITGVSVGTANITATNAADSGETDTISITVSAPTTTTLKLLAHIDALSATAVKGSVFQPGSGGNLLGAKIGDFTGEAFESVAESGQAPLLVPVTSFGGGSLTVSDTPVCVWEATSAAGSALGSGVTIGSVGPHECTVVEV